MSEGFMKKRIKRALGRQELARVEEKLGALTESLEGLNQSISDIRSAAEDSGGKTLVLSEDMSMTSLFDESVIYLDPRDVSVAPHIIFKGFWEKWVTDFWLSVVKEDSVVLDVGANFGYFGIIAGRKVAAGKGQVVLFEPNNVFERYINKSLSVNWLMDRVKLEALGVSNVSGKQELTILGNYMGLSSLNSEKELGEYLSNKMDVTDSSQLSINVVSIDDYCQKNSLERVNLIKLDIEGYEDRAYEGMRKTIQKNNDIILLVEFTKNAYKDPDKFLKTMHADFSYAYTLYPDNGLVPIEADNVSQLLTKDELWVMLVFAKKDLKR